MDQEIASNELQPEESVMNKKITGYKKIWRILVCFTVTMLIFTYGCKKAPKQLSEVSENNSISNISINPEIKYYQNQYASEKESTVSFGVTKPINLYIPGEKIEYYFTLKGNAYKDGKAKVTFYNKDLGINEIKVHEFEAGTNKPVIGSFSAIKNGVYKIKLEIPDTKRTLIFSVGVCPKATQVASTSFYYGIQPYLADVSLSWRSVSNREGYSVLWQTIDWLGCNLVRDGVSWPAMQADADASVGFTTSDRLVADTAKRKIVLDWCMTTTPDWAVSEKYMGENTAWNKPPDLVAWEKYIRAVAEHYKDADNILYEIWNEPDWEFWDGTIDEYLSFLELSATAIKSIKPDAYVFPGGMVSNYDLTNKAGKDSAIYYKKYKELLDKKLIDNYAIHVHGPFDEALFFDTFKRIDNLTDAAGLVHNKSFITEAGTWDPNDKKQAEELMGKILWSRANDYKMFVAYSYRGFNGQASRDWFDMMNSSLEPRDSYITYANLIKILGQAEYIQKIYDQKTLFADIYQDGDKFIVPVFASMKGNKVFKIRDGLNYEAMDIYGNTVSIANNQLPVSKSVVYLIFNGAVSVNDFSIE